MRSSLFAAVALLIAAAEPANAQQRRQFDHADPTPRIIDLTLNDRESFVIAITNTCEDAFEYSYAGVLRAPELQAAGKKKPLGTKEITVPYDARFGGYVFTVGLKAGAVPGDICEGGEKLQATSFIVAIRQNDWGLSFSGGFTISSLTNRVFAIKTEGTVKKVIEEPDKEDSRKLGAASFVHVFHDRIVVKGLQPALGFGLGINADNRAEYLVGGALRLGDKATITIGAAWGSISRLPNGITFDTPITDDNVLNNLGTQVVRRMFFGLSYSFIDTRERLLKPFATDQKAGTAATPATPAAAGAAGAKLSAAIVSTFQTTAANPKTYEKLAALTKVLGASGVSICSADASDAGSNTVNVTVHLKGASEEQVTIATGVGKEAAAAVDSAVAASLPLNPQPRVKDAVAFDNKCS